LFYNTKFLKNLDFEETIDREEKFDRISSLCLNGYKNGSCLFLILKKLDFKKSIFLNSNTSRADEIIFFEKVFLVKNLNNHVAGIISEIPSK
jgi:hypothetical protein